MEARKILFIDFDGTLTKKSGSQLVFTPFYERLFSAPTDRVINCLYESGIFNGDKSVDIIKKELFSDEKRERDSRRLTEEAIVFLNTMLAKENVMVFIISLNRGDYIEAMLKLENFSFEKLGIFSSQDGFCGYTFDPRIEKKLTEKINNRIYNKNEAVHSHLDTLIEIAIEDCREQELKNYQFYLFDDSITDIAAMNFAINQEKYDNYDFSKHYVAYRRNPGQFNWNQYQADIFAPLTPVIEIVQEEPVVSVGNLSIFSPDKNDSIVPENMSNKNKSNSLTGKPLV